MPQLSEWSQKLLVSMRADTSDIKAKLRELSGEEKKAADAALRNAEAENKRLDARMAALKKVAVAVGAVVIATKAWTAATEAYVKAAGPADERARAIVSANKSMAEALNAAKVAVGGLLAAFSPLVEILANVAMGIALVTRGLGDFVHEATRAVNIEDLTGERAAGAAARENARRQMAASKRATDAKALARFREGLLAGSDPLLAFGRAHARKDGGGGASRTPSPWGPFGGVERTDAMTSLGAGGGQSILDELGFGAGVGLQEGIRGRRAAGAESMFGELEKQIGGATSVLDKMAGALDTVRAASEAAFEAIVTGSKSAGQAIKEMIVSTLIGYGAKLTGTAIVEGVEALVSLALGDVGKAAMHGKAAASAGAGAVAVYGIARGLGVGGGSGAAASASAAGRSVNPYGGGGAVTTNIYVGAEYQDPYAMSRELNRAIKKGQRRYGIGLGNAGVEYR